MTPAYILLVVSLVTLRLVLRLWPDDVYDENSRLEDDLLADAERSFVKGMLPWRRARLALLSMSLLSQAERRRTTDLQQVRDESRVEPLPVVGARRRSHRLRDICVLRLSDGRELELTIYDTKVADAMVGAWQRQPDSAIRLTWMNHLGWCCTLHRTGELSAPPSAHCLAWAAKVTSP